MTFQSFNDIDSMWTSVLEDLRSHGRELQSRSGDTLEILGWGGTLRDPTRNFLQNKRRKLSTMYASAELLWYLSRAQSIEMLLPYAPQYKNFAQPNGYAHGAYGHRLAALGNEDQLSTVMALLRRKPNTRQAVIHFWQASLDLENAESDKRDIPCTLTWQFLVRNSKLHMVCTMRSNDVWLGMPYDVYVNTCIQQLMANTLGLELGEYHHRVGSMHVYRKDWLKCIEALRIPILVTPSNNYDKHDIMDYVPAAVRAEEDMRNGKIRAVPKMTGILQDTIIGVAQRWFEGVMNFTSPALRSNDHVDSRGT